VLSFEDLYPLLCEHSDDSFHRVGRQVRAIDRGSDVIDGDTAVLSATCDEVGHLSSRWRLAGQY
jgi:hypothetical protein